VSATNHQFLLRREPPADHTYDHFNLREVSDIGLWLGLLPSGQNRVRFTRTSNRRMNDIIPAAIQMTTRDRTPHHLFVSGLSPNLLRSLSESSHKSPTQAVAIAKTCLSRDNVD